MARGERKIEEGTVMLLGGHQCGKTTRMQNLFDMIKGNKVVLDWRTKEYPLTEEFRDQPSPREVTERLEKLWDKAMPPLKDALLELAEREISPFVFLDWGTRPVATREDVDAIYERELAESNITNME